MEKAKLPAILLEHIPWEENTNPIWPMTSFLLHRNLARYQFPGKLDANQSLQVLELSQKNILGEKELLHPLFLKAEELSPLDKEFLFEHFLYPESFQNTLAGQGFIIDDSCKFLAVLNLEDHLKLQMLNTRGDWEKTWDLLSKIDSDLSSNLGFAFSSRFGYLTADPAYCGTGLLVTVYLHLPALIHTNQFKETIEKQPEEEVQVMGIEGTTEEFTGDLVIMRNRFTLGVSEENILNSLHSAAMKFIALEKTMRTHLKEQNHLEMKDQVSRAYGLLIHSFQLQTKEALGALSLIKLGVDLGWISGISDQKLNETYFKCRRGHLSHLYNESAINPQELGRKRAEFLHAQLKGIELKI